MLLNGEPVRPLLGGGLWVSAQATLVVADLHLEKGSAFAGAGALLPPYDSRATLAALAQLIATAAPKLVVCLGDSFHDAGGPARLSADSRDRLASLQRGRDWCWLVGNHDPLLPASLGGEVRHELKLGSLRLRHQPAAGEQPGEVAGHLHPKASLRAGGRRIVRRCFVSDDRRMILPAFGAYAGGLDVLAPAFRPYFPGAFHAHMLGRAAVHAVPRRRLESG
ncbi:MAG: ligase-associated DNA damage response endonuclease PdeM [Alphaproteobacteria bacterium]|nr:ligase-associated DNA damage response endonuclease PdeM [Alphaproteobacteria bacterium]